MDERRQAEALVAAWEIGDADDWVKALVGLAPHLAQLCRQSLYPLWQETLPILAARTRKDLLVELRALTPRHRRPGRGGGGGGDLPCHPGRGPLVAVGSNR